MNHLLYFWSTFLVLSAVIFYLDKKHGLLRDMSTAKNKPYSFSKTQFAWWTLIVLSSLICVMLMTWQIPTFNESALILLGIGTATSASGRLIDISDKANNLTRNQDSESDNFFLDILSDESGVSLTRLQSLTFNFSFGCWFIHETLRQIALPGTPLNQIIPDIQTNNLILLGLSSATYAAFKTTENKK